MQVSLIIHGTKEDVGTDTATVTFANTTDYILSGSADGTGTFTVDDDLDFYINDVLFTSDGTALSGARFPIPFKAKKGDVIKLVVRDTYGHCSSLSALYVTDALKPTRNAKATDGFNEGCGLPGGDRGVQFTATFTLPF